ncbi:MAG: GNAT family N-acetyltransferase [Chloroflexaceae bacterium]|nr:GNAT family N-acetyltransferase [Chloroflexaceae bacterium]
MHESSALLPADYRFALAQAADFEAVATLFEALHRFNAGLDAHYTLAANWRDQMHIYFTNSCHDTERVLWQLVWHGQQAIALLVVERHIGSPLFAARVWAELTAIYIAEGYRGGQLSTQLIKQAQAWATAHGLDRIELYVTASNAHAKEFYVRHSFVPVQEILRLPLTLPPNGVSPAPASQATTPTTHDLLEYGQHAPLHTDPYER